MIYFKKKVKLYEFESFVLFGEPATGFIGFYKGDEN